MNKVAFFSMILLSSLGFAATDIEVSGVQLVAPSIYGKSSIASPYVGEIVLDTSDNKFYGRGTGSNDWQVFTQGVVSSSTPQVRVEAAQLHCQTSPGPSIDNEIGNWIASITYHGTGDCTVTFETSTFSAAPICQCTIYSNGAYGNRNCEVRSYATGSVRIVMGTGGSAVDQPFNLTCVGNK